MTRVDGTNVPDSSGDGAASYKLEELVAQGGMGEIWRARDPKFDRELAIKVLRTDRNDDSGLILRFDREADLAGALEHPSIPPVHDRGVLPDGRKFFSMKLIQGQTLAALLKQRRSSDEGLGKYQEIFRQVAEAVGYAHSQGVIHRDLKPLNVMVGAFGEVQVMDWGMAKRVGGAVSCEEETKTDRVDHPDDPALAETFVPGDTDVSQVGHVMGTIPYMPPEQARGELDQLNQRADVFALGSMLCEILTGSPAYSAGNHEDLLAQASQGDLSGVLSRLQDCGADAELVSLAMSCLAVNPDDRPSDASAVAKAMEEYEASVQARLESERIERAAAEVKVLEEQKRRRVTRLLYSAAIGLLLVGSAWAIIYANNRAEAIRLEAIQRTQEKQLESELQNTLNSADEELKLLSGKLLDKQQYAVLARDLREWESHLERVQSALTQAQSLIDNSGLTVSSELSNQLEQLRDRWKLSEADYQLGKRIETIRIDAASMKTDGKYDPTTQLRDGYRQLFIEQEWDQLDAEELSPAIRRCRTPWLWVRVGDAYASALHPTEDAEESARLRVALMSCDPGPWQDQFRGADWGKPNATILKQLAGDPQVFEQSPELIRSLTRWLRRLGEKEAATTVLEQATLRETRDIWLWMDFAEVAEDWQVKWRCYSAVLALHPSNSAAHNNLGVQLVTHDRLEDAEREFRTAINLDSKHTIALSNLRRVLTRSKRFEEAEREIRAAINLNPTFALPHLDLAELLMDQDRPKEAEQAYRAAIDLDPKLIEAHVNLGKLLSEENRLDEAEREYRTAIKVKPKLATTHYNFGVLLEKLNRVEEAEQAYRTAIQLDPEDVSAHMNLAILVADEGRDEEAERLLRTAIDFDPEDVKAHFNLGRLLNKLNRLEEAEQQLKVAIELDPDLVEPHITLGILLSEQGRTEEAEQALRAAVKLDTQDALAHVNLGSLLQDLNRFEEAEREYRTALTLAPQSVPPHLNLGSLLLSLKRFDEAEREIRTAIQLDPAGFRSRVMLGSVLIHQGRLQEAQQAVVELKQQSKNDQQTILALLELGDVVSEGSENMGPRGGTLLLSVTIYRSVHELAQKLTDVDSNNVEALRSLVVSHKKLGELKLQFGQPVLAIDSYRRAVKAGERLIAEDAENVQAQRDLSGVYIGLGDVHLRQLGQSAEALGSYRHALEYSKKVAEKKPNSYQSLHDLTTSYNRLGETQLRLGQTEESLSSFEHGLVSSDKLAKQNPDDRLARFNLLVSYEKLGDVQLQLEKLDKALTYYQQSMEISKKLADEDRENAKAQRTLFISYDKMGNVQLKLARPDKALASYLTGLEITEKLANQAPNSTQAQFDLVTSHYKLGEARKALSDYTESAKQYEAGSVVLRRMIERGMNVEISRQQLAILEAKARSVKQADVALGDWTALLEQPHASLPALLDMRAIEFARRNRFTEAAQAATKLRELSNAAKGHLYNAACVYSLCAAAMKAEDGEELSDEQTKLRQQYIADALATLKESIAVGWDDFEHMQGDPDLAVLRNFPEFKKLIPLEAQPRP